MTQTGKPTAGVLQISATATQKPTSSTPKKASKLPAPRLKLLIRRLPPGLTQAELETALGDDWKVGAGKVDWLQYRPGKVSKDPAKPSRPSRAYVHVVSSEHIASLSEQVRLASFQDARHTSHDPVLLGPPSLEFAPYAKTPGNRVRKDARQGTIDQDPDFIAFLESLTQPITKPATVDTVEGDEKKENVVTTPLVQFIKEKKASKAKESAASKSSKHGRPEKEPKQEKVQVKKLLQRPSKETAAGPSTEKKTKGDKAIKELAKAPKQANTPATKAGKSSTLTAKDTAAVPERKRERGNATVAAKILQRDLGLSPSGGQRRGKAGSSETASSKNERPREPSAPPAQSTKESISKTIKTSSPKAQDGEPASSKASEAAAPPTPNPPSSKPAKGAKGSKGKPVVGPTPTATQAFLKHANPSQGVTEALLEAAFAPFGTVTKVEIDKKKGFGYVDFGEPESLQKAIAASPVSVAQSQVVVLERKANPGGERSRKGRSEAQANSNKAIAKAGEGNKEGAPSSSARGSRGGRGSRNNKGSKGSGAGSSGNAAAASSTKTSGSEAN